MDSQNNDRTTIELIIDLFRKLSTDERPLAFERLLEEFELKGVKRRKRQEYSEEVKRAAFNSWKMNRNFTKTAEFINNKFRTNIDESYIRRWIKESETVENIKKIQKKPKLYSPKEYYPEMEQILIQWFKTQRDKNAKITLKLIKDQAALIYQSLRQKFQETKEENLKKYEENNFHCSNGWFRRFKRRANISRRIATHAASKLAQDYADSVSRFLGKIKEHRMDIDIFKKKGAKDLVIGNMDEIPIFYDMRSESTYHFKGDKTITLLKTNGYKKRATLVLGVLSNGTKLLPLVIFKRKNPPQNPYPGQVFVAANLSGWMTESIMLQWISSIWNEAPVPENSVKLLVCDEFAVHKKQSIKDAIMDRGDYIEYIPPGCTSLLQPLDLVINKPVKDHLRHSFEVWMHEIGLSEANKTKKGYVKSPGYSTILLWVIQAWNSIDASLVRKSFIYAGLNADLYGRDEHHIKEELRYHTKAIDYITKLIDEEEYKRVEKDLNDWNEDDLTLLKNEKTFTIAEPTEISMIKASDSDSDSHSSKIHLPHFHYEDNSDDQDSECSFDENEYEDDNKPNMPGDETERGRKKKILLKKLSNSSSGSKNAT